MKTTIDAAGRLVIPKQIRRQAGLAPGMSLEVHYNNGRVEIEPEVLRVRLVHKGRLVVATTEEEIGPLRAKAVEETRDALGYERGP